MRKLTGFLIWVIFLVLVSVNIYVFINSLKLSDNINRFEKEIKTLHQENLGLENRIYEVDSLQYAASLAGRLDFTQKAQPVYLDNLKYAKGN